MRRKGAEMKSRNVTVNIPVNELHPHPDNPRKDIGDITELTKSIKAAGMVYQNLTVIPGHYKEGKLVDGDYTIIIGHRRCAASKAAGIEKLPCRIIEDMDMKEQISMMLEENMQRNDLTVYEQAVSFQMMLDLGETEESLAERTGFSKQTIRHRIELAKLDGNLLAKKTKDEGFQMTLKDMYALEKIDDVNIRNEVLKDAENSSQLSWKIDNRIKAIEDKKKTAQLIEMLEEKGVTKAPANYQKERYSNKWNTVKSYWIRDEMPKRLQLPKSDEPYYYDVSYNYVQVIQKRKIGRNNLSEAEKKEKARKAAKKTLEALEKKLDEDIREFVKGIVAGRYTIFKTNENQMTMDVWKLLTEFDNADLTKNSMSYYLAGKNSWDMSQEEKEQYAAQVEGLTMLQQMIVSIARNLNKNNEIVDYNCNCKERESRLYRESVSNLEGFGFTIGEEERKLIDGTHELYGGN